MPGVNLVLEVKKDKQTGKLFIPTPKPGILTAYTGKIRFSGKYVGILPIEFTQRSIVHISSPINHIDFDWYITPTKLLLYWVVHLQELSKTAYHHHSKLTKVYYFNSICHQQEL